MFAHHRRPIRPSANSVDRANVLALLFKEQEAGALVGVLTGMLEKQRKTPKQAHRRRGRRPEDSAGRPLHRRLPVGRADGGSYGSGLRRLLDDFADPTNCANKADSQIAKGADVVFQVAGGCGLGVLTDGAEKGIYSIGVDTDQARSASSVIASAVKRVDNATFSAIKT